MTMKFTFVLFPPSTPSVFSCRRICFLLQLLLLLLLLLQKLVPSKGWCESGVEDVSGQAVQCHCL
jgi:hypothetical protein